VSSAPPETALDGPPTASTTASASITTTAVTNAVTTTITTTVTTAKITTPSTITTITTGGRMWRFFGLFVLASRCVFCLPLQYSSCFLECRNIFHDLLHCLCIGSQNNP